MKQDSPTITTERFVRRLGALVLSGVGPGLPRREMDAHVLLKAVALVLRPGSTYSEPALGRALASWLDSAGARISIDPVSLRRSLVDHGYLRRDAAGRVYEVQAGSRVAFAPEVDTLDPLALMTDAQERSRREAARRRALDSGNAAPDGAIRGGARPTRIKGRT